MFLLVKGAAMRVVRARVRVRLSVFERIWRVVTQDAWDAPSFGTNGSVASIHTTGADVLDVIIAGSKAAAPNYPPHASPRNGAEGGPLAYRGGGDPVLRGRAGGKREAPINLGPGSGGRLPFLPRGRISSTFWP